MKLSVAQRKMLEDVALGKSPLSRVFGAAAHGGANGTINSLLRRGLMKLVGGKYVATAAGKEALK